MRDGWTEFLLLRGWLVSSCARIPLPSWGLCVVAVVAGWLPPAATPAADLATAMAPPVAPVSAGRPVAVRITWGGGQPRAWTGRIAIVDAADARGVAEPVTWRTLSSEPDAAAFVHEQAHAFDVHQPRPIASDGIEVSVRDVRGRRLVAALRPVGAATDEVVSEPLDEAGNRFAAKIAAGDMLRVTLGDAAGDVMAMSRETVRRPGDRVRVTVDPLLLVKADSGLPVVLTMRLRTTGEAAQIAGQEIVLQPLAADRAVTGTQPVRFAPVTFDVVLPSTEGAYEIDLEAMERGSLRWTRPLASRTVQLIAVADTVTDVPTTADWKILYELDPGSPRLLERLRRLPGMGLTGVSLPSVPLPAMSLPAMSLPNLPLPRLPAVPVPSVPSLSSMVPRLSGLLAVGHSRVEPHPLGPMLRLPPPPNIPAIEPDATGATTIRQMVEMHRADRACAVCHDKMDPYGLAMESFDPIGGRRDRYRLDGAPKKIRRGKEEAEEPSIEVVSIAGNPWRLRSKVRLGAEVDASGTLADGRSFHDIEELKKLLLADEDAIAKSLAQQIVVYATGSGIRFSDRDDIDAIVKKAKPSQHGLRSLIKEIVQSDLFHLK